MKANAAFLKAVGAKDQRAFDKLVKELREGEDSDEADWYHRGDLIVRCETCCGVSEISGVTDPVKVTMKFLAHGDARGVYYGIKAPILKKMKAIGWKEVDSFLNPKHGTRVHTLIFKR